MATSKSAVAKTKTKKTSTSSTSKGKVPAGLAAYQAKKNKK